MKIFKYKGYGVHDSRCGVSIIDDGTGGKIVVLTELPDNPGTSVTNYVEGIATAVVHELLPNFPVYKIKWVEHYPDTAALPPVLGRETFDRVELEWDGGRAAAEHVAWRNLNFYNPKWSPMDKEEVRKIKEQMLI
ncbi:MAG: hypothetical protein WC976_06255 [Caldisericia bacterium]